MILDRIDRLDHISYQNQNVYYDLGIIVLLWLTNTTKRWFHALQPQFQWQIQQSWGDFKLTISTSFMNQQWFNHMKACMLCMHYHQKGHKQEMPSDYFHCKLRMIQEVFIQTLSETIMEIMNRAPCYWSILINTSRINTISDLQYYIKYHEEQLVCNPETQTQDLEKWLKALESRSHQWFSWFVQTNEAKADANFIKKKFFKKPIGAHANFSSYQYLKNNKVVSKGKTPEQKGAQPCRHCGSGNHCDFDHLLSRTENQKAWTFLLDLDVDALEAYLAYETCYLKSKNKETNESLFTEEQPNPCNFSEDKDFPSSPA